MDQINELISRGVANIIPGKDKLMDLLNSGKKLNIYMGIDPTHTQIHIGHLFPLRKLQTLSELGHKVKFLIGDFTALIGDTSDKDSERPVLTLEQIKTNFETYKEQAQKILDFSKIEVEYNSKWLGQLTFEDIIKLTRHFSLNDFISRELIKTRLSKGLSISLPEVLYPVMQGYDSYFMDTDLQIGGTDQTFNMQAGRTLQKILRGKESYVMSNVFLTGTDGRKMSKSWGNAIWVNDSPNEMFGKVMSIKDDLLVEYFTLATNAPMETVNQIKDRLSSGENPMETKKELASLIVSELHSSKQANEAKLYFEDLFQNKNIPQNIKTIQVDIKQNPELLIQKVVIESGLVKSNSDFRRILDQGGISINQNPINDINYSLVPGDVIKIGNRGIFKVEAIN